jgi:hypothetical protein
MRDDKVYVDAKIRKIRDLYADVIAGNLYALPVGRQLDLQVERLTEAHRDGNDAVCFQVGSWHPGLMGKPDDEILRYPFNLDDGRITIAREYGFKDWRDVQAIADRRSNVIF